MAIRNETKDLSADEADVLAMMKSRWEGWRKEMDASEPHGRGCRKAPFATVRLRARRRSHEVAAEARARVC